MKEVWVWLPDWAADMALWEDDLVNVAPQADHTFISYASLAASLDNIAGIPGMDKATTVVGWGLGALALMKNAASLKKCDWILLSPFADFCDDSGEWTQQNLRFMAKQCLTNPEPSLNTFAEVFENEFGDWQDDWMAAAKKVDKELLSKGLNYLAETRIKDPVGEGRNVQVVYGRQDSCVLPAQTLKLKDVLPGASFKERPKAGHWPPLLLL